MQTAWSPPPTRGSEEPKAEVQREHVAKGSERLRRGCVWPCNLALHSMGEDYTCAQLPGARDH